MNSISALLPLQPHHEFMTINTELNTEALDQLNDEN